MPLHPDPEASAGHLLSTDDGTPLARLRLRDDDGERVAGEVTPLPGAGVRVLAAQARRDLAGARLVTPDDDL
ncbi:N-acetyltransferase, partial [Micromonospora purpureochromogenes]